MATPPVTLYSNLSPIQMAMYEAAARRSAADTSTATPVATSNPKATTSAGSQQTRANFEAGEIFYQNHQKNVTDYNQAKTNADLAQTKHNESVKTLKEKQQAANNANSKIAKKKAKRAVKDATTKANKTDIALEKAKANETKAKTDLEKTRKYLTPSFTDEEGKQALIETRRSIINNQERNYNSRQKANTELQREFKDYQERLREINDKRNNVNKAIKALEKSPFTETKEATLEAYKKRSQQLAKERAELKKFYQEARSYCIADKIIKYKSSPTNATTKTATQTVNEAETAVKQTANEAEKGITNWMKNNKGKTAAIGLGLAAIAGLAVYATCGRKDENAD